MYGTENIIKRTLHRLSNTKNRIDVCISSAAPEGTVKTDAMFNTTIQLNDKGIKIKYLTEITKENLSFCKRLMETGEVRHMDGIKGNYSIVDGIDYQATAAVEEGDPQSESVLSNVPAFVDQQQFVFDMLWNKAIPTKQRIKEIEQGLKREFIETIQDPIEIRLYHMYDDGTLLPSIGGHWSPRRIPAMAQNADGRLEVFMVGSDGRLYHRCQTSRNGTTGIWDWYMNWVPFGKQQWPLSSNPAVARNRDGRLEVGSDGRFFHKWQTAANSNTWSVYTVNNPDGSKQTYDWTPLGLGK